MSTVRAVAFALACAGTLAACARSHPAGEGPGGSRDGGGDGRDGGDGRIDGGGPCVPAPEICDGLDQDCDGPIDEGEVCGGPSCGGGGATECGAECVVPGSDERHCGGCFRACADRQECDRGRCCARLPVLRNLDMLFVIDNSNSMTEEQTSLGEALPRMITILASGDLDPDDGIEPGRDFAPIRSLQVGAISTDMGTGGFVLPTCRDASFGDDGVLRTQGNGAISGCLGSYPAFLSYMPASGADPTSFAQDFRCIAQMGTGGCGFEQHLEAVLKAVTPSSAGISFARGTTGHGDRANATFVRPDADLAVIVLSDEEDCSVADPGLFDIDSPVYSGNINLRCFSYPMAVHPLERYVDGLLASKADPARIHFDLIAGVPVDAIGSPETIDYGAILAHPLMQEMIDPSDPNRLRPSCDVPGRGIAFPPRRLVRVAQRLEARGANATVVSICQPDFTPVLDSIVRRAASTELVCP